MPTMNEQLAEFLQLPPNTVEATLRLRAGDLPHLTVTTVLIPPKADEPLQMQERFFHLVPIGH